MNFFTNLYDKFTRKVCSEHILYKKISCDICIKIESIFSNKNGETFLNASLNEATVELCETKEKRKLISRETPMFFEENYCDNCYFFENKDEKETSDSDSDSE